MREKRKEEFVQTKLEGLEFFFGSYGTDNYSGDAFILLKRNGELFEVNGGHCSCYGLEDQYSEEPTSFESIEHRLENGSLGVDDWSGNEFKAELIEFLKDLRDE